MVQKSRSDFSSLPCGSTRLHGVAQQMPLLRELSASAPRTHAQHVPPELTITLPAPFLTVLRISVPEPDDSILVLPVIQAKNLGVILDLLSHATSPPSTLLALP